MSSKITYSTLKYDLNHFKALMFKKIKNFKIVIFNHEK